MRFSIVHQIKGRMRVHVAQKRMSYEQADVLYAYLIRQDCVTSVKVRERTQDITISYTGDRAAVVDMLRHFSYDGAKVPKTALRNSGRALNDQYWQKLVSKIVLRAGSKLFVPYSIREASGYHVTVKGGRYLEAVAEADTIVFDKTGTLTKAQPTVVDVISFNGQDSGELLRIAACLEEHFPHSMAKAVVDAARARNLVHDEMHSKVEYVVAHGISTMIEGKRAVIGSYHFVFEDESCRVPEGMEARFDALPNEYSHLYLAIESELAAVICIEDPLREEAADIVRALRSTGIQKVVMMTGDSDRTAKVIAARVGVDEYYSEVLPEDKAEFVEHEKKSGRKVIMIGDGINDSPALSAADVGIAISDGAELARDIADVTIDADNLYGVITLKQIGNGLMKRIHSNYRTIVGFNSGLILLGIAGLIQPTTSALLHNASTLAISLKSMDNCLPG